MRFRISDENRSHAYGLLVFGLMTACTKGPALFKQSGEDKGQLRAVSKEESDGTTSAALSRVANLTQVVSSSGTSGLSGVSVAFPPGSLAIDTTITIESGAPLVSSGLGSELGLGSSVQVQASNSAVVVSSSVPTDAIQPFTIALPMPSSSLRLNGFGLSTSTDNLIVIYKISKASTAKIYKGVIDSTGFTVEDGFIKLPTRYFGAYQAAYASEPVTTTKEFEVNSPILTAKAAATLTNIEWKAPTGRYEEALKLFSFSVDVQGLGATERCTALVGAPTAFIAHAIEGKLAYQQTASGKDNETLQVSFECLEKNGRVTRSPWSAEVKVPTVTTAANSEPAAPAPAAPAPAPAPVPPVLTLNATIAGLPSASNAGFSINIAGTDITQYKAKHGSDASIDCNSAGGYGSIEAIATPFAISVSGAPDGLYKVCVLGGDAAGNWQTSPTSATWTLDTVAPTATLSAITSPTTIQNFNVTVAGTDVVEYKAQFGVAASTNCNSSPGYSAAVPVTTPLAITASSDDTYKVCVIGKDAAGNWQNFSSSTSATWILNRSTPTATIPAITTPTRIANFSVAVGGAGLTHYKSKYGLVGATDCANATGYNAEEAIATAIVVAPGSDGDYKLCVLGKDSSNTWQTYASATFATWTLDTTPPSSVPVPNALPDDHQIKFTWAAVSGAVNYVVLRGTTSSPPALVDGTSYFVNDVLGTNTVVYTGTALDFTDKGLTNDTDYHYSFYAVDALKNYSIRTAISPIQAFLRPSFKDIAVGTSISCALSTEGKLYCWGTETSGELGNGSGFADASNTPIQVTSKQDVNNIDLPFTSVSASYGHVCAVTVDRKTYCWGFNATGQLGVTDTSNTVSANVHAASYTREVAAGNNHSCALASSGGVQCWGNNTYGQVGDNSNVGRIAPVSIYPSPLGSDPSMRSLTTGGYHTCAIKGDGTAWCWGKNLVGQLGDSTASNRTAPVTVSGSHKFVQITAGDAHTCAIDDSHKAYCWGYGSSGNLGNNSTTGSNIPVAVVDPAGEDLRFVQLAAGRQHTCGVDAKGRGWCWGEQSDGRLGNGSGSAGNISTPNQVSVPANFLFKKIAASDQHSCGISISGDVACWGAQSQGRLGNGSSTSASIATPIVVDAHVAIPTYSRTFIETATSGSHSCAISGGGKLFCWGNNTNGQLGDSSTSNSTVPVLVDTSTMADKTFRSVALGTSHTCAISASGKLFCWGDGAGGRLGNNASSGTYSSPSPVDISGLAASNQAFIKVATGGDATCALTQAGRVYCFGNNAYGQLGKNDTNNSAVPVSLFDSGSDRYIDITAGLYHMCATRQTSLSYCWGKGETQANSSALGIQVSGPVADTPAPTAVLPGDFTTNNKMLQMTAGNAMSCGLSTHGDAACWGFNGSGQLGDNSTNTSFAPISVSGGLLYLSLAAGNSHVCGLTHEGMGKCWGACSVGQSGSTVGCGSGYLTPNPIDMSQFSSTTQNFIQIGAAMGANHSCGILGEGILSCWGQNSSGQIGNGNTTNATVAKAVDASGIPL